LSRDHPIIFSVFIGQKVKKGNFKITILVPFFSGKIDKTEKYLKKIVSPFKKKVTVVEISYIRCLKKKQNK
jgi:arabinogalactan endo-1,4-beta-galactosidase